MYEYLKVVQGISLLAFGTGSPNGIQSAQAYIYYMSEMMLYSSEAQVETTGRLQTACFWPLYMWICVSVRKYVH
jgi:hypothetical protein